MVLLYTTTISKKKGYFIPKYEEIKNKQLTDFHGIIDDIHLKEKEIRDTLRKYIEEDKDIQEILSSIKRLEVN